MVPAKKPPPTSFDPAPPTKGWEIAPIGRALRNAVTGSDKPRPIAAAIAAFWIATVAIVSLLVCIACFVEWNYQTPPAHSQQHNDPNAIIGFWGGLICHLLAMGILTVSGRNSD